MSGTGQLWLPPSQALIAGPIQPAQPYSGTPTIIPTVANVTGVADCTNLLKSSPPTLLELFEIYAFSIPYALQIDNTAGFAVPPTGQIQLALYVGSDLAGSYSDSPSMYEATADNYVGSGVFQSDLVNPIRLAARDRLAIKLTGISAVAATTMELYVGVVLATQPVNHYNGAPATINYNVIDLPASRRL